MTEASPKPFTMEEQPTSTGRLFLARAFAHWCALHHGCDPDEVEAALSDGPCGADAGDHDGGDAADDYGVIVEPRVRRQVRDGARLIGELVAAGRLRTFARPLGGGETIELKASAWDLDEYRARFASSALDPKRPFDADAMPTHWLFVDMDGFNALTAESCGETPERAAITVADAAAARTVAAAMPIGGSTEEADSARMPRFLRLPEVKARTGMSRSTIYNRIRDKQFPAPRNLGGNISAWTEAEVDGWIRDRAR